jgi:S-DNA-T family DNA segregation ATPase FtsK/SpoIIIE
MVTMRLRVTVVSSEIEVAAANVEIRAATGSSLGSVADDLATAVLGPTSTPEPLHNSSFHSRGQAIPLTHPLGLPPLVQGSTLVLGAPGHPERQLPGLTELHVVAGPDSGPTYPLAPDTPLLIGRQGTCDIPLADPDVSRHHAEISTSNGVVTVRDLASVNGTRILDGPVGEVPQELLPGTPLRMGDTVLVLRGPSRPVAATTPDGAGHLLVNRRTPLREPRPFATVERPAPPHRSPQQRLPWLMVLAPLLLAGPAALIWHQPGYLVIAALSPLLMLAQYVADRRSGGRETRRRAAEHEARLQDAEKAVADALRSDVEYLERTHPDPARIGVTARIPTDELWHRTPEHPAALTVRIGRGPVPSSVTVRDPAENGPLRTGPARLVHTDAPVVLDLRSFRVIGISGEREAVLGTVRAVIGQLAVLHSPHDLTISLLRSRRSGAPIPAGSTGEWDWLAWLPHHTPAEPIGPAEVRPGRAAVLILDGAQRLRRRPEVADLLTRASAQAQPTASGAEETAAPGYVRPGPVRIVVCLAQEESSLPLECTATLVHRGPGRPAGLRRVGRPPLEFRADRCGLRWITRLARDLAPLKDATPDEANDVPHQVRLLDLLRRTDRPEPLDPAALARSWRADQGAPDAGGPAVRAVLGLSASGAVTVDLRADGPHVLIGGTTGSGKSELLQTMIASLALGSGPERLVLLLVDYKGGAAFQACTALPHVAAVLTDLDPRSARRALSSFTAELRRREGLLRRSGTTDIDHYAAHRADDPKAEPMPRLVVIVDEFRVLVEELPEFVAGLVRIATVGRSLGVHLVLATQRPAGVVSSDIAANVNLRIALRVRDPADSRDLIADPSAADLPAIPGRALIRAGAAVPVPFQTARVNVREGIEDTDTTPSVRLLQPDSTVPEPAVATLERRIGGPTDLECVVTAARAAATVLGLPPARAPWLPELPGDLKLEQLNAVPRAWGLPFARADFPEQQLQETAVWDLTAGHLAVVGGPRSGRSTLLRTLCAAAATSAVTGFEGGEGPEVHVYVLDATGRLSDLDRPGITHGVIRPDDHERAGRLLRRLVREARDRREAAPGDPVLLLVDGWEALLSAWAEPGHTRFMEDLLGVLRDGPGAGIGVAVAGGVSLLTGATSSLFTQRLVLGLPDPADAMMVGVPASLARNTGPPGRGLCWPPGRTSFALPRSRCPLRPGPPADPGRRTSGTSRRCRRGSPGPSFRPRTGLAGCARESSRSASAVSVFGRSGWT